jgi:hypothetical protein
MQSPRPAPVNLNYNVASSSLTATTTKHIFSPDGTLLATVVGASTTATTTYLHPDHLGGTNVATDEDGAISQTLDYYPYGAVTSVGSTTYTYDNSGNVSAIGSLDYTWDWRNRLASAERSGGGITTYGYDHSGQRVFQATGTATTSYPSRYYNVASSSLSATTTKHIFSPDGTLLAVVVGIGSTIASTYLHPDPVLRR